MTCWPVRGASCSALAMPSCRFAMLMFDRISEIAEAGGEYGKGLVRAVLELKPDLWFFPCHFKGDPVAPGCLGLDALWQLLGFFLGWLGAPGKGRALGLGELKFSGQVLPTVKNVVYGIDIKRVVRSKLVLGIADGWLSADGSIIYRAIDLKVGLFRDEVMQPSGGLTGRRPPCARSRCGRGIRQGSSSPGWASSSPWQQHPESAGEPARGQVGHFARRQIRRARVPLPGAGAPPSTPRRRSTAAPCASGQRRGLEPCRHGAGDPRRRPRGGADISNEMTGIIMGSGGPSTRAIVEAADTAHQQGPKRVSPFAVPKAMSSTASATLATWFKIQASTIPSPRRPARPRTTASATRPK